MGPRWGEPVVMDPRRAAGVVVAALVVLVAGAAPAFAAPQRLSSDPEPGAELHEPPSEVFISFSEPLDESSEIRVIDECDRRIDDRDTRVSLNEVTVGIEHGPIGTYTVAYKAVGVTGTAQDAFTFTVLHGGPSCDGSGGGHGGHGDGGGDDGGGHGGHDMGDDGGDGGHGGHDGGAMDHTATAHEGSDHAVMGHREMKNHRDGHHKDRGEHNKHADHKGNKGPGNPPQAAGPDGPLVPQPGAASLLSALALATLLGVAGGWVLRVSNPS
jgi:methionine-rich copper-binding protein CopC